MREIGSFIFVQEINYLLPNQTSAILLELQSNRYIIPILGNMLFIDGLMTCTDFHAKIYAISLDAKRISQFNFCKIENPYC